MNWTKLKVFADNNWNVANVMFSFWNKIENIVWWYGVKPQTNKHNIVRKEKMPVASIFPFLHNVFKWPLIWDGEKSGEFGEC